MTKDIISGEEYNGRVVKLQHEKEITKYKEALFLAVIIAFCSGVILRMMLEVCI